jgi:hypothetical protein
MKIRYLLFTIVLSNISALLIAQFPEFKYEEIGKTDENLLCQQSLADVDNDSDLDIIVGSNTGTIWWFENIDGKVFTRHLLGEMAKTDKGGVAVDVDGDGLIDQVSGGTWFKNPGNKTDKWQRFENGAIFAYDMLATDLNNDGKPEIIATSELEGTWAYFPGTKPEKKWKKVEIGVGAPGGIGPKGFGDFDDDKDIDIVRTNLWFDNLEGTGEKWIDHKTLRFGDAQGKFANSSRVFAIDMDGDGDMDIVQAKSNTVDGEIVWQEKKDARGKNWYIHPVASGTGQDMHSLCVADFDGDGDFDIFSGGGPMGKDLYKRCFIWENADGIGVKWIQHEVSFKVECIDAMAGDIDGDGDIDIVGKPWKGETIYILRNNLK